MIFSLMILAERNSGYPSSARAKGDAKGEEFRTDLNHQPGQNTGKNTVARGARSLGIRSRKALVLERKNS